MWSDGYQTDIDYTGHYFSTQSPWHLGFLLALRGLAGSARGTDFDYMELGFGQGLTTTILAAANPRARFIANDFNPAHVQGAQARAAAAGLTNVTFLEDSFAALDPDRLPRFDFITLHGIYSWISPEARAAIRAFIARALKPGGVVYISYNAQPGWAGIAPLQWLMRTVANGVAGPPQAQLAEVRGLVERLAETEARYFRASPTGKTVLDRFKAQSPNYLIHEFFNAHWDLLPYATVAAEMGEAKLRPAGTADAIDLFEDFVTSKPQQELLAGIPDATLRETVRDFVRNTAFRRDVYVKGGIPLAGRALQDRLAGTTVSLIRPRVRCVLEVTFPIGKVRLAEGRYAPILDALAEGPATLGALTARLAAGTEILDTARRVATLAAAGYVAPGPVVAPDAPAAPDALAVETTRRLNRVLLDDARGGSDHNAMAAPAIGGGIGLIGTHQRVLFDPAVGGAGTDGERAERLRAIRDELGPLVRALGVAV